MKSDGEDEKTYPLSFFWEVLKQYENEESISQKVFGYQIFPAIRHNLYSLALSSVGAFDGRGSSNPTADRARAKNPKALKLKNSSMIVVSAKDPERDPHLSDLLSFRPLRFASKTNVADFRAEVLGWRGRGIGKYWALFVKGLYFLYFLFTQSPKYAGFFSRMKTASGHFRTPWHLVSCYFNAARLVASIPPQIYEFWAFRRWLKRSHIKKIIIKDAYTNAPLISAAKTLGIKTFEVQHGIIHRYHPGYAYTQRGFEIQSFPDFLLSWGPAWTKDFPLPKGSTVISIGYPLALRSLAREPTGPREIDMMFTSQPVHGDALIEKAKEYALEHPQANVVFRLHPKESKTNYNANLPDNLSLSDVEDCNFQEIASDSKSVAGVFSTTLLESAILGCTIKIIPLAGSEVMEEFVTAGIFSILGGGDANESSQSKEILLSDYFQELTWEELGELVRYLFTEEVNSND